MVSRNFWAMVASATVAVAVPSGAIAQTAAPGAIRPVTPAGWTARLSPFAVADSTGRPIAEPFLGGFDVPRPQLVDIDGDGDQDLFVQERTGELMYFEREGGRWVWRTDRYQDLDIAEWFRFADINGDGLTDLMAESRYSYIRAWLNQGTRSNARFVMVADTVKDADGKPLFADRQNILNVVDIDCNGRLDLFIGQITGTIDRYEAEPGASADGLPRFRRITERWEGIEILGGTPAGPSATGSGPTRHGANTMGFGDVDNDGDLDLFWGDFFEPGVLLMENTGTCAHPSLRSTPRTFPVDNPLRTTGYNAPAPGDIDGDGDLDLVIGVIGGAFNASRSGSNNLYQVEQTAKGVFDVITARAIPTIDVGSESTPALTDYDGDGDLDLLVGNKLQPDDDSSATITWFENTGSAKAPAFRDRGSIGVRGEFHLAPTFADLDGDGTPDLLTGIWRDRVQWWRNSGTRSLPKWTMRDSALVTLTRGSNTIPTLGDLDGDGDLDLVVGESSGQLNLYRNDGNKTVPSFVLVSDTLQGIDLGRRSIPTIVDFDGDGKPDLVIGSEEGDLQFWRNISAGSEIRFERTPARDFRSDPYVAPAFGDLDGDGDLDLVVGGASGGLRYFERERP
jgi:hypothetical protein